MSERLRVLVVEDSEDDTALIERALQQHGLAPVLTRVDHPEALHAALDAQAWDVVVSDYSMPSFSGLDALRIVRAKGIDTPFIIVSGSIGEETAVAAMKLGAQDYIMKDRMARLAPAIERELLEAETRRERRRAEERVRYYAYYDPLTDLPNLVQLTERLEQAVAANAGGPSSFALLTVNLSRFREVNETLGHDNGDELLRQVSIRLRRHLRRSDMAARIGGDEFALLLDPATAREAQEHGEAIQHSFETAFDIAGFSLELSAHVGIALFPGHDGDARQLLQRAEVALSLARDSGVCCLAYDALRDPSNPQRLLLLGDLRAAVNGRRLTPHFQPKIALRDGAARGVEALVRWQHPHRGPVPPDEFIPLAERAGLIGPLTASVLDAAMEHARAWQLDGWRLPVAVNLSVKNMLGREVVQKVEALLAERRMEPWSLELEITESALMQDPIQALDVLGDLSALGITLYIDDFGTGYSSLAYLKKLPVKAVKIDKSFVIDMATSADSATIVRSTIELAHNLGLKVVAEGVESAAALERLKSYGCDEAQGYFIARPMPPADLTRWLAERAA
jgi:diguanylate cyclase (GGDEF)-like protein